MTITETLQAAIDKLNGEVTATLKFAADESREPTADELAANQAKLDEAKALQTKLDEVKAAMDAADAKLAELKTLTTEIDEKTAETRKAAEQHFSREVEGKPNTTTQILNFSKDNANMTPELQFSKELSAFAAGKEYEFAAITVAGNTSFIPKAVELVAVRKNFNAFRRLLEETGYSTIDLSSVQNIDVNVIAFADGRDGVENGPDTDETPTPVTLSLAPTMVTSGQVWFGAAITEGPAFDAAKSIYPGLQRAVERREENKWFAALKTQAAGDASMIGKTTASTTAITYDEFVDWRNSVGTAYNVDAVFVISIQLKGALEKIKDTNGNPILVSGTDGITRIDGKPVIVSDAFETLATGKYPGAIISAEAVRIVDAGPTKLKKFEGESGHSEGVGFEIVRYSDAKFVPAGVKLLKMA